MRPYLINYTLQLEIVVNLYWKHYFAKQLFLISGNIFQIHGGVSDFVVILQRETQIGFCMD